MLINVYVASPDPDPNPRGGGQLPNPNECNSTLTSGTNNIYPYPYIDVNDRGHRLGITHTHRRLILAYNVAEKHKRSPHSISQDSFVSLGMLTIDTPA